MKCEEVNSLIHNYFDDRLDEFTKIKIHHHLAQCQSCTEDFHMWQRGDEYMRHPHSQSASIGKSSTAKSLVMDQVMNRIKQEEKWANPAGNSVRTYKSRTKRALLFVACMLMLFFTVLITSTFIPQKDVVREDTPPIIDHVEAPWENTIVMKERMLDVETSLNFEVVASIHAPLVYVLPVEEHKRMGYPVIFSIFGLLCIIIMLSWITRV